MFLVCGKILDGATDLSISLTVLALETENILLQDNFSEADISYNLIALTIS